MLLNKGDTDAEFTIEKMLSNGLWTDAMTGQKHLVNKTHSAITTTIKAHGVTVLLLNSMNNHPELIAQLMAQQKALHTVN